MLALFKHARSPLKYQISNMNFEKKKMFRHCVFFGFQWCIIAALMILQKLYVCEKYVSWVIDENAFEQICTYKTVGDLSSIFCM